MNLMLQPSNGTNSKTNSYDAYNGKLPEDRCAERIRISAPASLRRSGEKGFAVEVVDISVAGFACKASTGMHEGTTVWLTLPGLAPQQAEIVRNDGFTLGCAFSHMLNEAVMNMMIRRFQVPANL